MSETGETPSPMAACAYTRTILHWLLLTYSRIKEGRNTFFVYAHMASGVSRVWKAGLVPWAPFEVGGRHSTGLFSHMLPD